MYICYHHLRVMGIAKPTSEVKNRWNAKAYDRIMFVVTKDDCLKERIKGRADSLGMSVNSYLTMLVEEDLGSAKKLQIRDSVVELHYTTTWQDKTKPPKSLEI